MNPIEGLISTFTPRQHRMFQRILMGILFYEELDFEISKEDYKKKVDELIKEHKSFLPTRENMYTEEYFIKNIRGKMIEWYAKNEKFLDIDVVNMKIKDL
ncbi:hypothetical protein IBE33_09235 [Francisella philomiragia]|uniref:hypothetical protein n=1 Tax=Francisella philomiragia TaxID=28110 RepID=UPI001904A0E7|nr:hypothetical protein [Francisella philomiragia]MBK2341692.1 hypothetical protein [Francisella philomiragia]